MKIEERWTLYFISIISINVIWKFKELFVGKNPRALFFYQDKYVCLESFSKKKQTELESLESGILKPNKEDEKMFSNLVSSNISLRE